MHDSTIMMLGMLLLLMSSLSEYAYHVKVSAQLPTVDLNYAVYRATALNVSPPFLASLQLTVHALLIRSSKRELTLIFLTYVMRHLQ